MPEHLSIFNNLLGARCGGTADESLFGQKTFISGNFDSLQDHGHVKLIPPFVLHHFDSVSFLLENVLYQKILPGIDILEIPQLYQRYKAAFWWSQHLSISKKQPVCILANWVGEGGQIINDNSSLEPCAGRVEYFLSQKVISW